MIVSEIKSILFSGGNVVIDAANYSVIDLRDMAFAAKGHRSHLYIKNASILHPLDCKAIAFSGGEGTVTFDFTIDHDNH